MKILLAIDDSECSAAAVNTVASLFRPEAAKVYVLSVADWTSKMSIPMSYCRGTEAVHSVERFRKEQNAAAKKLVLSAVRTLYKAGLRAECSVIEGGAHDKIIDFAKQWQPDLIVMGSHGRRGVDRLLLGSVAETVSRHAGCSVFMVRGAAAVERGEASASLTA